MSLILVRISLSVVCEVCPNISDFERLWLDSTSFHDLTHLAAPRNLARRAYGKHVFGGESSSYLRWCPAKDKYEAKVCRETDARQDSEPQST